MDLCIDPRPSAIVLASNVTSITQRQTIGADTYGLTNRTSRGILIDEIVFSVRAATDDWLGGAIGVKLRCGPFELTNGFVPLGLLTSNFTDADGTDANNFFVTTGRAETFIWALDTPMYMPPGFSFAPIFSRNADGASGAAGIWTSLRGRYVKQKPARTRLPYVNSFSHTRNAANSISNNTDIQNPFTVPLTIPYFTGAQDNTSGANITYFQDSPLTASGTFVDLYYRGTSRLTASPIPFNGIFRAGYYTASAGNLILDPRDWLVVKFIEVAADIKPMLGVIGYREERL